MLAGLFSSNQPAVLLAVPILVGILFAPALFAPYVSIPEVMPLTATMESWTAGSSWVRNAVGMLLVALVAVQLVLLVNNVELMERRNHLPAYLFPVLLAAFAHDPVFDGALLGMPFVIAALRRTWSITNNSRALGAVFDAGSLLGIAAMCYLPYAFLLVVVWSSISAIRPFHWREYLLPLFGTAWVFYVAWAALTLMDLTPWRPLLTVAQSAGPFGPSGFARGTLFSVLALFVLAALAAFANDYQRSVMRGKNLRASLLAFMAALAVLVALVKIVGGGVPPVMVAVPLALLLGYALQGTRRRWMMEMACLTLLAIALFVQWA